MNNKNRVNGFKVISTGSLTASQFTREKYGGLRFTYARLRWCLFATTQAAIRRLVKKTRRSHGD
jgi:hypothetical protein